MTCHADKLLQLLVQAATGEVRHGGLRARAAQRAARAIGTLRRRIAVDPAAAALVGEVLGVALAVCGPTLRARRRTVANLNCGSDPRISDDAIAAAMRGARSRKEAAHRLGCSLATLSRRLARV